MAPVAEPRQPGAEATEESEPPRGLDFGSGLAAQQLLCRTACARADRCAFAIAFCQRLFHCVLPQRAASPKQPDRTSSIDCLLAALRTIQAEGGLPMASRVAVRMKELFPHFDVKKVFGSKPVLHRTGKPGSSC